MAEVFIKNSSLRLVFENGVDDKGKPVFKTKTFNNIRLGATPENLLQVAQAIESLSQKALFNVERNDSSDVKA